MALTEAYKEGTWLFRLLQELHQKVDKAFVIWCDNRGAISFTANPGHHKRTKHIDIRYHLIREAIEAGKVEILPIETRDQAADILIEALKAPLLVNSFTFSKSLSRASQFCLNGRLCFTFIMAFNCQRFNSLYHRFTICWSKRECCREVKFVVRR